MHKIEAVWEKNNLGVNTLELKVDKNDKEDYLAFEKKIKDVINETHAQYIVCKIPTKQPVFMRHIQNIGFTYIESQISLKCKLSSIEAVLEKYEYLSEEVGYYQVNTKEGLNSIRKEILKGIFDTDRIALDPEFGLELSNKRYSNWAYDLYCQKCPIYIIKHHNVDIGFIIFKEKTDKIVEGVIGGLYNKYKHSGMGHYWKIGTAKILKDIKKNAITKVSSNNIDVLKLHEFFGYIVTDIESVFIKHI